MKKEWTENEIMRESYRFEIYRDFRDKAHGAYCAAMRLGLKQRLIERFDTHEKRGWSEQEVETLMKMKKQGYTFREIDVHLGGGRGRNAVAQKYQHLRQARRKHAKNQAIGLLYRPLV